MKLTECMGVSLVFGGFAAIGAASAIALEKTITKYGHHFSHYNVNAQFGIKSLALIATIGAIQNLLPYLLTLPDCVPNEYALKIFVLSHVITAGALLGVTALAAKTNLIANHLTLFAGTMLLATSLIENMTLIYLISRNY